MIDQFLHKRYNKDTYNCAHFVSDIIEAGTGINARDTLNGFLLPAKERTAQISIKDKLRRIDKPVDYCIVLMTRRSHTPHVGVYIGGKVAHITEDLGAHMVPLFMASIGFDRARFYKCLP